MTPAGSAAVDQPPALVAKGVLSSSSPGGIDDARAKPATDAVAAATSAATTPICRTDTRVKKGPPRRNQSVEWPNATRRRHAKRGSSSTHSNVRRVPVAQRRLDAAHVSVRVDEHHDVGVAEAGEVVAQEVGL